MFIIALGTKSESQKAEVLGKISPNFRSSLGRVTASAACLFWNESDFSVRAVCLSCRAQFYHLFCHLLEMNEAVGEMVSTAGVIKCPVFT